jgi:hypothetical protein
MASLEDAYSFWQQVMYDGARYAVPGDWQKQHAKAVNQMVDAFALFANIYPLAVVMPDDTLDYDNDESITKLDFTYLGSETYQPPQKAEADPPQVEDDLPKAQPEDIEPVLTSLLDNGPRAVGTVLTSLLDSGPNLLGSAIEGVRQDKETKN